MNRDLPFLAASLEDGAGVALAVVVAAFAGALLAGFARLPKPAGYLLAGVALGPAGLGWVEDRDQVTVAAEIGVGLLLFSVGLELSFRELARDVKSALLIGLGEAVVVGAALFIGARFVDLPAAAALVLAGAAGLSSTAAGVALLSGPGSRAAALAPLAVGVLIVQDVLAVAILALVPSLDAAEPDVVATALLGVGAALLMLLAALPLAAAVASLVMRALAGRVDRELFLVAVLAVVGGAAAGTAYIGLSPALGAFVAGFLIRQSGYGDQALRETGALRDVFAAIFFVSVGLLFRPGVLESDPDLVVLLLVVIVPVKLAAIVGFARLAGFPWKAGVVLGAVLANAGEFSFLAADVADPDVLDEAAVSALVFVVVVSLVGSSVAVGLGRGTRLASGTGRALAVVGYGRLGSGLATALREAGHPVVVVERDAEPASQAQADGFPVVWGDARQRGVMSRLRRPSVVVVTPGGRPGIELVEALAAFDASDLRVVSPVMPPRPASLGLDLTVFEVDRRGAAELARQVALAAGRRAEPFSLTTAGGTMRFQPSRRDEGESFAGRLLRWFPWAAPNPADCPECRGRGRRYSWPVATTCSACRGTGRSG